MPGYFMVSTKIFREHPSQLKLASGLALKALASKSFSGVKQDQEKISFKRKQPSVNIF